MAKCKKCEGWGFVRDPASEDGWARDKDGNGIPCPARDEGGCNGGGTVSDQAQMAQA